MCKPDPLNCDHCDTASHGELPVDKLLRVQKCKVHRSVWFSSSWFGIKVCSRSTKPWLLESHLFKGKSDRPLTQMYITFWHIFPWKWCQKLFSYIFVWGHLYSLERCVMEWNANPQPLCVLRRDYHGTSTFTHYSLTSETSILDLYPTLRSYTEVQQTSSPCSACDVDWGVSYRWERMPSSSQLLLYD